ncbi:MAG: hypothetical protein K8T90_09385 [Planctomycetes bacterium]|nr:hypothetical protein [Planctomycetota bacterium]
MLLDRPRGSTYETIESLHLNDEGMLVAALSDGEELLLFVPRSPEIGRLERERLDYLAGPGIPPTRAFSADRSEALVLVGAASARPLSGVTFALPDGVWRPALVHLLSALGQAHSRGLVHGRLSTKYVLADPSGEFWIHGWAGAANAVGRGPFHAGIDDVAMDVRDLGIAFVMYLGGGVETDAPAPPPTTSPPVLREVDPAVVKRASSRVAIFDSELARVLVRLVATDPREAYESATEILSDLGERDESLPDPWLDLTFVARRRLVRNVLAHVERTGTRNAEFASVQVVGPPGSGRTRFLHEIARIARARRHVVMTANGGAPQQPWGAIGGIARQMMARLPTDHPLRAERGVRILVGETPSPVAGDPDLAGGDGASAALAELLRATFEVERGVILLDDEDGLAGHASHAWRLLERHLSALTGPSSPRVLIVSASTRAAPDEIPTARKRIELNDLHLRHLTQMLATAVTERGKAPILAAELAAAAGYRPGDVVEHMREMAERHAIVLTGHRFHIDDPVEAVRAASASRLRRAIEIAGRDANALAETLAVAGRLRLTRDVLSEIADLPGHRLQAASDAALRAGLLNRDGATWRLRTESQRARLLAGLPDDRRRGLHREVLSRLLDQSERDWPAVAHHGRASADPRAADWTRQALTVLRASGRFDEAADHFDDALARLAPGSLDIELRLVQLDTLLHAGRLDDATRCADEIAADSRATPNQRGHALLALARLHRYDQAWSRVLAIELPADCGDPTILAKIRLLQSIAHLFRGRPDLADREERLALAEVGDGGATLLATECSERRSLALAMQNKDRDAIRMLVARLRSPAAELRALRIVLDLCLLAVLLARLRRIRSARRVLTGATARARRDLSSSPFALAWIYSSRAYVESAANRHPQDLRALHATTWYSANAGAKSFHLNQTLLLVSADISSGCPNRRTMSFSLSLLRNVSDITPDTLAFSGALIARLALFFCDLRALEELSSLLVRVDVPTRIRSVVSLAATEVRLQLDADAPCRQLGPLDSSEAIAAYRRWIMTELAHVDRHTGTSAESPLIRTSTGRSLIAYCVRRFGATWADWPEDWSIHHVASSLSCDTIPTHAAVDLASSLVLRCGVGNDEPALLAAENIVMQAARELPAGIDWRRRLAVARVCWDTGRIRSALEVVASARQAMCVSLASERTRTPSRA